MTKRAALAASLATALAVAALMTGCSRGSDDAEASPEPTSSTPLDTSTTSDTAEPTPTVPAAPAFAQLSPKDLESALLTLDDMPAGYSQDPPSPEQNKTFCDYKVPYEHELYASHDFTKGSGMSTEFVSVTLRQYASSEEAEASFEALKKAMKTCHGEEYDGSQLEYALMSAPKIGDDALGLRVTVDGTALLQNFVLDGPTLISTGGGGLLQSDADEINSVLEAQVRAYEAAAKQ